MNKTKIAKIIEDSYTKIFNEIVKEGDYFKEFNCEVKLYTDEVGLEETVSFSTNNFYHDETCTCSKCKEAKKETRKEGT